MIFNLLLEYLRLKVFFGIFLVKLICGVFDFLWVIFYRKFIKIVRGILKFCNKLSLKVKWILFMEGIWVIIFNFKKVNNYKNVGFLIVLEV